MTTWSPIASGMLSVFAPQILLYGLAVVLYGILQAHRKFTAPAIAPILSSVVVIAAYLIFVPLGRHYTTNVDHLPLAAQLTLSVGTTLGVAALAVTALVPAWRLRLRVRPTLTFPPGIARRATGLAGVGVAALVAQNASVLVVTRLANAHGGSSGAAVTVYQYGWQVFVSVYAVFAIPFAISAFPVLSAREGRAFDGAAASATRATALASWLGAGLLAAVALPVARAFPALSHDVTGQFALALALFAPGLAGYGLVACLSRVLLADNRIRIAAVTMVAGWLVVIVVDVVAVPLVRASAVVPVLGLANTVGMTAAGPSPAGRRALGQGSGRAARGLACPRGRAGGCCSRRCGWIRGDRAASGFRPLAERRSRGARGSLRACRVRRRRGDARRRRPAQRARQDPSQAAAVVTAQRGDPGGRPPGQILRVGYVLGTTEGGTGRHVAMLARGSAAAGLGVRVFGPAATGVLFEASPEPERRGRLRGSAGQRSPASGPRHNHDAAASPAARGDGRPTSYTRTACGLAHSPRSRCAWPLRTPWPGGRRPALVVTVHNAPPPAAPAAAVYSLLERIVARQADVVLCVSSDLYGQDAPRRSEGRRPGDRPGASGEVRRPRPADLTDDGRPMVLAVGRLAPQKGLDTLIAAAARWRGRRPEPVLVIAGTGPLAGDLAAQARDLGVTARFLGRRDDVGDLLAVADVFALPSRWEGQPLVLQEAMRAGRPIVATDVGGVRDLDG